MAHEPGLGRFRFLKAVVGFSIMSFVLSTCYSLLPSLRPITLTLFRNVKISWGIQLAKGIQSAKVIYKRQKQLHSILVSANADAFYSSYASTVIYKRWTQACITIMDFNAGDFKRWINQIPSQPCTYLHKRLWSPLAAKYVKGLNKGGKFTSV